MVNLPEVSRKIGELHVLLKGQGNSPEELANKINNILLFGDKIPKQILLSAWDAFAQERGVRN